METVNQQKHETITKQKNPLRVEQGKILVEYNHRKKEELKHLNEQITKQDDMIERKPEEPSNNYLYFSGLSVVGLAAIVEYLLHNKFKKPEQNLIDVPPELMLAMQTLKSNQKEIFFKYIKNFFRIYIQIVS